MIGKIFHMFSASFKSSSFLVIFATLLIGTALSIIIGFILGIPLLLPVLTSITAYLVMIRFLYIRDLKRAVSFMLFWALMLGILMTLACYMLPERAGALVINGPEYKNEMFKWIKTGIGREGTPSEFIPQHLLHLSLFIALSLATASFISMIFGAVLMNYMAYYVANLMLCTDDRLLMFLVGWHFWSLFRITGFVILGVVFSELLLHKLLKYKWEIKKAKRYIYFAAGCIITDIALKAAFAPEIGKFVRGLMKF